MLLTAYSYEVLIGFVIFMCVSKTESQFIPINDNSAFVRPTITEFPSLQTPPLPPCSSVYANNVPFQQLCAVPPTNTYSASSSGNLASASSTFVSSTGNSVSSNGNFALASGNFPSGNGNIASSGVNVISSSSAASSSVGNYLPPAVEDNSNAFAKAVLALPELQNLSQFQISGSEASDLFSNIATNILNDLRHPTPTATGKLVGQGVLGHDVFTLPIYFQAIGNTMQKFLVSEGYQSIPDLAEKYASIIASGIRSADINSNHSLFSNIINGFVSFIQSLGYDFNEKADDLTSVFYEELLQAQKG